MSKESSRRDFARTVALGASSLGAGASSLAMAASPDTKKTAAHKDYFTFPKNFIWACATASYQVEGAVAEDGRKPSVWDTYAHTPGKIAHNDTGDVSVDQYHLYKSDVALMKQLGVKAYRMSTAWPRVFPDGNGQPNPKGMDFYDRMIDELLANGIVPYVTLFHWDLPQALEDKVGGWLSRDTSKYFADYAGYVSKHISDRVSHFFTINEFSCFIDEGYGSGTKAPGRKCPLNQRNEARHNALMAHGLGARAIRASATKPVQVGIAENPALCVPVIETAPHIKAAQSAMRHVNGHFLTAVLEGKYPESYLQSAGTNAPKFTSEEMQIIGTPLDFVGLNIYAPAYVRADDSAAGFAIVPNPSSQPRMASPWLYVGPQIAYWAPRHLKEIWGVNAVFVTENGCSANDNIVHNGQVLDTDRVMYLRNHLQQAHRAISEGWPLKGYFLWSLLDNFEWGDGYTNRFGIVNVDLKTQKRTPKLSADFYQEVIARNAVV